MANEAMQNIMDLFPVFFLMWAVTVTCIILRPQKYSNSVLLMMALAVTVVFIAGLFGENMGYALLGSFVFFMLAVFLVPLLLIINGIQMIRRESFSLANVLSLVLGIFVGIGEIATIVYVLGLAETITIIGKMHFWVMLIIMTVFYFSVLVLNFVLYSTFISVMPHRMDFDYVIIHGCGLADGEKPTKLLSDRIDKAMEVYNKCIKKPCIIASGGKGSDEKISEAQAMRNYMVEHRIPERDIIMENASATTRENLTNSMAIINSREGGRKTALVSSNYHIYRCLRLATELGFRCTGIGAHVAFYYWPSALIREFIAVFLTRRFLFWSLLGYLLFVAPLIFVYFG
ncbi:MAG: YdcF family protein [Erysipelotrichaceae bacterium]|nr:YdcF family protein [Erysipelotrichaceae bacterium]